MNNWNPSRKIKIKFCSYHMYVGTLYWSEIKRGFIGKGGRLLGMMWVCLIKCAVCGWLIVGTDDWLVDEGGGGFFFGSFVPHSLSDPPPKDIICWGFLHEKKSKKYKQKQEDLKRKVFLTWVWDNLISAWYYKLKGGKSSTERGVFVTKLSELLKKELNFFFLANYKNAKQITSDKQYNNE